MELFMAGVAIVVFIYFVFAKPMGGNHHSETAHMPKQKPTVRRQHNPITADITTESITLLYDPEKLESLSEHILIKGSEKEPYIVNLKQLSCTCQDYLKNRSTFQHGDIRRMCKHQARAIVQSKQNTKITTDKRIKAIVRTHQDRGFSIFDFCLKVTFNEPVKGPGSFYLFDSAENDWANIVLFTEKSLTRYGYNKKENRWEYGQNPFPDGSKKKYNLAIHKALGI